MKAKLGKTIMSTDFKFEKPGIYIIENFNSTFLKDDFYILNINSDFLSVKTLLTKHYKSYVAGTVYASGLSLNLNIGEKEVQIFGNTSNIVTLSVEEIII